MKRNKFCLTMAVLFSIFFVFSLVDISAVFAGPPPQQQQKQQAPAKAPAPKVQAPRGGGGAPAMRGGGGAGGHGGAMRGGGAAPRQTVPKMGTGIRSGGSNFGNRNMPTNQHGSSFGKQQNQPGLRNTPGSARTNNIHPSLGGSRFKGAPPGKTPAANLGQKGSGYGTGQAQGQKFRGAPANRNLATKPGQNQPKSQLQGQGKFKSLPHTESVHGRNTKSNIHHGNLARGHGSLKGHGHRNHATNIHGHRFDRHHYGHYAHNGYRWHHAWSHEHYVTYWEYRERVWEPLWFGDFGYIFYPNGWYLFFDPATSAWVWAPPESEVEPEVFEG